MSAAALSAGILGVTLLLFVSERVRHDLVALAALFACLAAGLIQPRDALAGFADPAVVAVAAILVVGRAVELSGAAGVIARVAIPAQAAFAARLAALMAVGAFLSAFMNNIAALVITMPLASQIAREHRRAPAATLMPLAFATILGGMTTLIGTPANLILSSVREEELGEGLGFFAMTPVGMAVALAGLAYLALLGWRLLPNRETPEKRLKPPWRVFELLVPTAPGGARSDVRTALRHSAAKLLAAYRGEQRLDSVDANLRGGDRLLVLSRARPSDVAAACQLETLHPASLPDSVTARVVVAHGSFLIGQGHDAVATRSNGALSVEAAGPRAARQRMPLGWMRIAAGDQLFVRGRPQDLARFLATARLLEIDRLDPVPVAAGRAWATLALFLGAIAAILLFDMSPAIAFLGAAALMGAMRLIPADEIYRSVDWSVIVLLAALIPVGQSFEASGAAAVAAGALRELLSGMPLVGVLAALCTLTLLLSIFLNNVATAIIMGPLAIDAARLLGVDPDLALLAVLIGASSDFLTPIGHQNNLLVMGPGGYRFTDYARMGAPLVLIVVATAAAWLAFV